MIDLRIRADVRDRAVRRAAERGGVVPTFAELRDPSLIAAAHKDRLTEVGLWDTDPANLFRIGWDNETQASGGGGRGGNNTLGPPERAGGGHPARGGAGAGRWQSSPRG